MFKKRLLTIAVLACLPTFAGPADGLERPPVPSVLALSNSGSEAELLIYGLIGDIFWDGITAVDMVALLSHLDVDTIRVRINSRGGVASEGISIYNALKRHPANIVVVVDGSAESIASLIAMAGDEVVMPANTLMMLHAPYTPQGGNAKQKREQAEALDSMAAAMAESYIAKTGKRAEIEALLADGLDHYFTAAQAIELGLADRIEEFVGEPVPQAAAAAALCSYISAIAHAPQSFSAGLRGRIQASTTPLVFASLPEETQRAVVAHIEDPSMKQQYLTILANGAVTTPPTAAPANVTAPPVAVAVAPAVVDTAAAVAVAMAALRDRNTDLVAMAAHLGNPEVSAYVNTVTASADLSVSYGDATKHILALLAKGRAPLAGGGHVVPGADDRDKQRHAMAIAIDSRTGFAQSEGDNPYRGFTMFEMARACAERAGVNTRGMDRMDVVASAFTHSTSDFPLLMGDVAHKSLKRGYDESAEVFPLFTRAVTLTDFKPTTLAGLGRFSNLDVVREGGEYKYGTFNESGSALRLVTYGKMFSVTRQAVINDDLNALSDVPRKMGQAAKRTLGNAVFGILTANPVMGDGKTLFHADHGNLVTPGTVISTTSVDGLRVLMALQKDADGSVIHVPLKYLVVPVGLGGLARTVLASEFEVSGARNNTTPNIVRNSFEIIEDPRLDAADPKAWYGVADPSMYDGIAVGYLDGKQEPYLESKQGWNVDGTEWKVRLDAAAAAVDHMALAKNPGV